MDTQTLTTQTALETLSWSAPIHPVHERSKRWYIVSGLVVLGCAVYGIFSGSWSFSVVIVLVGGMYALLHRTPPVIRRIVMEKSGYTFEERFTAWDDCGGFWFVRTPGYTELHISKKKKFQRETIIHTGPIEIPEIRAFLSQYLTEKSEQQEKLLDIIIRFCKL